MLEGCDFVAHKDNHLIHEFYTKHYDILKKFIEQFKIVFADVIAKAENCKAKYKNGFISDLPDYQDNDIANIQSFLSAIGASSLSLNIDGRKIQLTRREMQCLELIDEGYTSKIIGKKLLISPKTIETHIYNIKQKTGINYKHDLIRLYRQLF